MSETTATRMRVAAGIATLAVLAAAWLYAASLLWRTHVPADLRLPRLDPHRYFSDALRHRTARHDGFLRIDFLRASAAQLAALLWLALRPPRGWGGAAAPGPGAALVARGGAGARGGGARAHARPAAARADAAPAARPPARGRARRLRDSGGRGQGGGRDAGGERGGDRDRPDPADRLHGHDPAEAVRRGGAALRRPARAGAPPAAPPLEGRCVVRALRAAMRVRARSGGRAAGRPRAAGGCTGGGPCRGFSSPPPPSR